MHLSVYSLSLLGQHMVLTLVHPSEWSKRESARLLAITGESWEIGQRASKHHPLYTVAASQILYRTSTV